MTEEEIEVEAKAVAARGWVYFVRAGDAVKIGWSLDPERRIADLQVAQAEPLVLLGAMPAEREDEAALHRAFAPLHVRGEWFRADPGLLAAVAWIVVRERQWRNRLSVTAIDRIAGELFDIYGELLNNLTGMREFPDHFPAEVLESRVRLASVTRTACEGIAAGAVRYAETDRKQRAVEAASMPYPWRDVPPEVLPISPGASGEAAPLRVAT